MEVKNVYLQYLGYSKNPSKLGEKVPENFHDLHENSVGYAIENENWQKEGRAMVVIEIKTEPKDLINSFVKYEANYRVTIENIDSSSKGAVIDLATSTAWDRIHADYVKSFNELELPTQGFPAKPVYSEENEITSEK